MRNDLGNLARLDAVIERMVQVTRHLDRLVARNKDRKRDDAAVARRKTRTLPQVSQNTVLRVLVERGRDHSDIVTHKHGMRSWLRLCRVALRRRCADETERRKRPCKNFHLHALSSAGRSYASLAVLLIADFFHPIHVRAVKRFR